MIHLLRLHAGWIRYADDDTLQHLLKITKEDMHQILPEKRTSLEELVEEEEDIAGGDMSLYNTSRCLMYQTLFPGTELKLNDELSKEKEIESPTVWRMQYKKELFHFIKDKTVFVLNELSGFGKLQTEEEARDEMNEIMDLEYSIRVILLTLMDDEAFECMYMRSIGKDGEDDNKAVDSLDRDEEKDYHVAMLNKMLLDCRIEDEEREEEEEVTGLDQNDPYERVLKNRMGYKNNEDIEQLLKTREVLTIMNWRSYEILEEVGTALWNLIIGLRLLARVRTRAVVMRKASMSLQDILFMLHLVEEHRNGGYFPTCFNAYKSDGMQKDFRVFIYMRDILLDELGMHFYNQRLLETWDNKGRDVFKYYLTDNNARYKRTMKRKAAEERMKALMAGADHLFKNSTGAKHERSVELELDEENDSDLSSLDEEEEQREDDATSVGSAPSLTSKKNLVPQVLFINGKLKTIVFRVPPHGTKSCMTKRIEKYENRAIKRKTEMTRKNMLLMQHEHRLEMRSRKGKKPFLMDDTGGSSRISVAVPKGTVLEEIEFKDVYSELQKIQEEENIEELRKENDATQKRIMLHPSIEDLLRNIEIPGTMKKLMKKDKMTEQVIKNMKLTSSSNWLRSYCNAIRHNDTSLLPPKNVRMVNTVNEEGNEDGGMDAGAMKSVPAVFDAVEEEEKDRYSSEVFLSYKKKTDKERCISEIMLVGLFSLSYNHPVVKYTDVYKEYKAEDWDTVKRYLISILYGSLSLANQKQMVAKMHEWIVTYLHTQVWKRKSYEKSELAQPMASELDKWKYIETSFMIRVFENENLYQPLIDLIEREYPGSPFIGLIRKDNIVDRRKPIIDYSYLGTYITGFNHTLLSSLDSSEINEMLIGDYLNQDIEYPFQMDCYAYVIYWWCKQKLVQSDVDIDRTVFMWEMELKYMNLYRGVLLSPFITRIGSDWCVYPGGRKEGTGYLSEWMKNGGINVINCGNNIFIAFYVWMDHMKKHDWQLHVRSHGTRKCDEYASLEEKGPSLMHRMGEIKSLDKTNIKELYDAISASVGVTEEEGEEEEEEEYDMC